MTKSNFDNEMSDEQVNSAITQVKKFASEEKWEELESALRQVRFVNPKIEKELLGFLTIQQFTFYKHYLKDEE